MKPLSSMLIFIWFHVLSLMHPLHKMATFVPPLCDHNICQVAVGGSKEAEWRFRHRHGRHKFLNMFKTVAQRSPRRLVARRWLKGGRREAQALPWLQNGGTVVDQWSPGNRCFLLQILAARMKLMEKRQNQGIYIPRHSRLPSSRQGVAQTMLKGRLVCRIMTEW